MLAPVSQVGCLSEHQPRNLPLGRPAAVVLPSCLQMKPLAPLLQEHWLELQRVLAVAWPIICTNVLSFGMDVTDLIVVGKLGKDELAATGLAITWSLGLSIFGFGMAEAATTIMGQAFGRGNFPMIGVCLHVGMMVLSIVSVILGGLWLLLRPILLAIGTEPHVADLAQTYITILVPSLPALLFFILLQKYIGTQNVTRPALYCALFTNIFNIFANILFVFILGMGYVGCPLATVCSRWMNLLLLAGWIKRSGFYKATWVRPSLRTIFDRNVLKDFVVLGFFGGCAFMAELWGFQSNTVLANMLGKEYVAANAVIMNFVSLGFMAPLGLAIGTAIRVSNLLGDGDWKRSKVAARASSALAMTFMLGLALLSVALRQQIAEVYSDDTEVVALVVECMPIFIAYQLFDGLQAVLGAVLRSMGLQKQAALLVFIGFYCIGIPVGYALGIRANLKLVGMWLGVVIGIFCMAMAVAVRLVLLDWEAVCVVARRRTAFENQQAAEDLSATEMARIPSDDDFAKPKRAIEAVVVGVDASLMVSDLSPVSDDASAGDHATTDNDSLLPASTPA